MTEARHAVILSGGGANGAYEVGVMEALLTGRCGGSDADGTVEPAIFTGTSVGSYNAAAMVCLSSWGPVAAVRELRDLWVDRIAQTDLRPNGVFRLRPTSPAPSDVVPMARSWARRAFDLAFSEDSPTRRLLRFFDTADIFSTAPLDSLVAETIDPERILASDRLLRLIACNWDTGEPVVFFNSLGEDEEEAGDSQGADYRLQPLDHHNALQAILASTAIPAIFPQVVIENSYFADGGVVMNTPLRPAIRAGASVLHVIHLEPGLERVPLGRAPSALEAVERILAATPTRIIDADIEVARLTKRLIAEAKRLQRCGGSKRLATHSSAHRPGATAGRKTRHDDLAELDAFIEEYGSRPDIEVHRYYPSRPIDGAFGLLDFHRGRIIELIELGFRDAVEHDCAKAGCVR